MTPVFLGRIQTRLFVSFFVGGFWTLIITPFLPLSVGGKYQIAFASDVDLSEVYKLTFAALAVTTIFGCLFWEPLYHFLMQFRWEKDWPAFFHLIQVIPEGITTFLLLHVALFNPLGDIGPNKEQFVPGLAFAFLFLTTWIITWLAANGPMKIFFVRWRFFGGRLV